MSTVTSDSSTNGKLAENERVMADATHQPASMAGGGPEITLRGASCPCRDASWWPVVVRFGAGSRRPNRKLQQFLTSNHAAMLQDAALPAHLSGRWVFAGPRSMVVDKMANSSFSPRKQQMEQFARRCMLPTVCSTLYCCRAQRSTC